MDRQPSGGSGASSSGSQRKALKRPRCTSDSPPSSAPEELPLAQPKESLGTRPGMPASETYARLMPRWDVFNEEDSGDLESPAEDSEDLESSVEYSEDNNSREEDPTDNGSPAKDPLAPDSNKPAELALPAVLKSLKGRFTSVTLDYHLPCTAAEGTTCQILGQLSEWNEFLFQASLQLRETSGTTGNLALSCEPSLTASPSIQQCHQVATLVYWLLKTHHCLVRVELNVSELEPYGRFLCDGLQGNLHVTSLKLTFFGSCSRDEFTLDLLSLSRLEELECSYALPETLLPTLSRLLRTSTSLRSLRILSMTLKCPNVEDLFRALAENRSLEELALPNSVITNATPTARAVFMEFLKKNTSLKTLSFAADYKVSAFLQWILEGLLENKSVVSVSFKDLLVDRAAIQLMAKIFIQNRVLRSFTLSYEDGYGSDMNSSLEDPPTKSDFGCLHKGFVQNSTLELVSLPIEFWNAKQWKAVFKVLPSKDTLKMVTITGSDSCTPLFEISAALEETGAEEKVSFKASFTDKHPDKKFDCKAFSEAVVYAADCNSTAICAFLKRLPSLSHIKSLQLELDKIRFSGDLSLALTTFLGETRTLKTLIIDAWRDGSLRPFQDAIVKGVAINTSLKELSIRVMQVKGHFSIFARALANAVRSSKNISNVDFDACGNPYAEHAFLQRLSVGIANNCTLLSVTFSGSVDQKTEGYWFQVWDVMRRNYGLVMAAADFLRGVRHDRHCALALEQVRRQPGLVEEVARLESVDEAQAAAMVLEGFRIMVAMPDFV